MALFKALIIKIQKFMVYIIHIYIVVNGLDQWVKETTIFVWPEVLRGTGSLSWNVSWWMSVVFENYKNLHSS